MFDDHHSIAHIAQAQQRIQQRLVIARVQADTGLVEDIGHAHQAAAQLAGQADAL